MFESVLIVNRGEIARRIVRTVRRLGLRAVVVHSEADTALPFVREADEAVLLEGPPATAYRDVAAILAAAAKTGAQAVHPGYGFLSENAAFARAVQEAGLIWVGPSPEVIESMGDKIAARNTVAAAGMPVAAGTAEPVPDEQTALVEAERIGYPLMIKAAAGGGGMGMAVAASAAEVAEQFSRVRAVAEQRFGDPSVLMERYIARARHVEVQILGLADGRVVALGERDCSVQRRNQKVAEESPAPGLPEELRARMHEAAVQAGERIGYRNAGTMECLVDVDSGDFVFLEMNTRLQVEHPVTELVTGVDLVEQMIRVAAGERLALGQGDVRLDGWAIESRLYAEDPYRGFLPSTGRLTRYRPPVEVAAGPMRAAGKWLPLHDGTDAPEGEMAVRNDTGVFEGGEISVHYDPMIAKLCTWAPDRAAAIEAMRVALNRFEIEGIGHNLPFLSAVMDHPRFVAGEMTTGFIAEEFPEGFAGVELPQAELARIAAAAAAMHRVAEIRRARISGRMDNHERRVGTAWVVMLAGTEIPLAIEADPEGVTVTLADGRAMWVVSDWRPGAALAVLEVDGRPLVLKVEPITGGYRLRTRGADLRVTVLDPRQAELARLMPRKREADMSKMLLCPMPGLVVKIDVETGQEVQQGQPLCTIEAMKMENVLRAERRAVVSKINAGPGDSLAVDEVIMEFE